MADAALSVKHRAIAASESRARETIELDISRYDDMPPEHDPRAAMPEAPAGGDYSQESR
jgi:hypothetical protein